MSLNHCLLHYLVKKIVRTRFCHMMAVRIVAFVYTLLFFLVILFPVLLHCSQTNESYDLILIDLMNACSIFKTSA